MSHRGYREVNYLRCEQRIVIRVLIRQILPIAFLRPLLYNLRQIVFHGAQFIVLYATSVCGRHS